MNTNNIDIFIFVKSKDKHDRRSEVVNIAKNISGIAGARIHPQMKRLVEISYNPQDVDCSNIINRINVNGCDSVLVGM